MEVFAEPIGREPRDVSQGAGFLKKMGSARDDFQVLFSVQRDECPPVEFDDDTVFSANDQEGGRADALKSVAGQIGPPPAGNNRLNGIVKVGGSDKGGGRPCA